MADAKMPSSQAQHGQATFLAEHLSAEALLDSLKMILADTSLVDVLTQADVINADLLSFFKTEAATIAA